MFLRQRWMQWRAHRLFPTLLMIPNYLLDILLLHEMFTFQDLTSATLTYAAYLKDSSDVEVTQESCPYSHRSSSNSSHHRPGQLIPRPRSAHPCDRATGDMRARTTIPSAFFSIHHTRISHTLKIPSLLPKACEPHSLYPIFGRRISERRASGISRCFRFASFPRLS